MGRTPFDAAKVARTAAGRFAPARSPSAADAAPAAPRKPAAPRRAAPKPRPATGPALPYRSTAITVHGGFVPYGD